MKIIECLSECLESGPDILAVEGDEEFMLLLSRDKEASDYLAVYFNDKEVLEGARAEEVLKRIEKAEFSSTEDTQKIYERFVDALKASTLQIMPVRQRTGCIN